jgi:hypothetical protein
LAKQQLLSIKCTNAHHIVQGTRLIEALLTACMAPHAHLDHP